MRRTDTLGYKIRLIHNQIHRVMEVKRRDNEGDLTEMQRWTIGFLKEHEGQEICQRDIEAEFSISRATASNMLQLMERKKLIERSSVAHDARLKKLVLTRNARDMLENAEKDMREMESILKKGMSQEEAVMLSGFLDRVILNLEAVEGECRGQTCGHRESRRRKEPSLARRKKEESGT